MHYDLSGNELCGQAATELDPVYSDFYVSIFNFDMD